VVRAALPLLLALFILGVATPVARAERAPPPIAITGARILTGTAEIPSGTVVVTDGKIAAVGPSDKVEVPPGAERIDGRGKTVIPGLVNPWTQVGSVTTRASGGVTPHLTAEPGLAPGADSLAGALRAGYTTLAVTREGEGLPGTGIAIRPVGNSVPELVVARDVYLRMTGGMGTGALRVLTGPLQSAKQELDAIAAYEKAAAGYKKAMEEYEKLKGEAEKKKEKPPEAPKIAAPKPPQQNPRLEAVRKAVAGELPVFVRLAFAREFVHFANAVKDYPNLKVTVVFTGGDGYRVAEEVERRKWTVVLPPVLTTNAYTRVYRNVPAELAARKVPVAFYPTPDTPDGFASIGVALGILVRAGLDSGVALQAVTLTPARLLGLDKRVGSIETGKDGNLVILTGDPFDARTRIERVLLEGRTVHPGGTR